MPAAKLERRHSVHYITFGVMDRVVRVLSGNTPCCLPPPALDFRKTVDVNLKARKLSFTAVPQPPEIFEQDSVVFRKLGDIAVGMVVLASIENPFSFVSTAHVVQMIGPESKTRRHRH